jgi:hypothetical protein
MTTAFDIVLARISHGYLFEDELGPANQHALRLKRNVGLVERVCIVVLSASPNLQVIDYPERYWGHDCDPGRDKNRASPCIDPSNDLKHRLLYLENMIASWWRAAFDEENQATTHRRAVTAMVPIAVISERNHRVHRASWG